MFTQLRQKTVFTEALDNLWYIFDPNVDLFNPVWYACIACFSNRLPGLKCLNICFVHQGNTKDTKNNCIEVGPTLDPWPSWESQCWSVYLIYYPYISCFFNMVMALWDSNVWTSVSLYYAGSWVCCCWYRNQVWSNNWYYLVMYFL